MSEASWPESIVRSKGSVDAEDMVCLGLLTNLGRVIHDGPRPAVCADCGEVPEDGLLVHVKPETYAVTYQGETFYLERHLGVACGCAAKRGLEP